MKNLFVNLTNSFRSRDLQFFVILLLPFQHFPFKMEVSKRNNCDVILCLQQTSMYTFLDKSENTLS